MAGLRAPSNDHAARDRLSRASSESQAAISLRIADNCGSAAGESSFFVLSVVGLGLNELGLLGLGLPLFHAALQRRRAGCTIPNSRDFSACDLGPRFARSCHGAGLVEFKDLHPLAKLPAHPGPARGSFGGQRRETYNDVILRLAKVSGLRSDRVRCHCQRRSTRALSNTPREAWPQKSTQITRVAGGQESVTPRDAVWW
jgi:hypothetical protein